MAAKLPLLLFFTGAALAQQPTAELAPLEIVASEADSIVVTQEELGRRPQRTLGEVLEQLPGFSNRSFGPGVGQPVIRGQAGPRVKVMRNSLGTNDLSSISPDHAVGVEILSVERIEVLRGPDTLRYGSGIIGGVVNVLDGRIPRRPPDHPIELSGGYRYDSPSDGHTGKALLDLGAGPLALHLEGMRRDNGDLATGRGTLDNTSDDVRSGSVGASWVGEQGFAGAATERLENNYGIPTTDGEKVRIDLRQTRHDLRARWNPRSSRFESLEAGVNINDYRHVELEDGRQGSLWRRKAIESRLELTHSLLDIPGHLGFQSHWEKLSAKGDEAILPPTEVESYALFIEERVPLKALTLTLGGRLEHRRIQTDGFPLRRDLPVSGAIAASWSQGDHWLELSLTATQRVPTPQELYVFGMHDATRSFKIGDAGLNPEQAFQLQLGYRLNRALFSAEIDLFQYWINDYIFFQSAGVNDPESGLPVFRANQRNAAFSGYEARLKIPLRESSDGDLTLELFSDYTRGRFRSGGDVPRMPPLRYGLALDFTSGGLNLDLRLTRAEPQDHPGSREISTPGYVLLDIGGEYTLHMGDRSRISLFTRLTNLLDQTVRHSTSYLRAIAPAAGRGVTAGVKLKF